MANTYTQIYIQFVFAVQDRASLPNSYESNVIKNQLAKSGTSVGANYREANRSRSKVDFRNKIKGTNQSVL